jgi:anti-sigma factor RsiW
VSAQAPPGLTCKEVVELVTEYLEGTMQATDVVRFETHLRDCDGCTRYLEQMRQTIAALGHLPEESLTVEMERDLLAAFEDWRSRR